MYKRQVGCVWDEEYQSLRRELTKIFNESEDEKDLERMEEILTEMKSYYPVLVDGNGNKEMEWKTPSQFPVRYESYQFEDLKCRGRINSKQIKHTIKIKTTRPDLRGYMCGIAPNYVHSLDSSHLSLIVDQWSGAIGAVHDSFCTHASDVDNLVDTIKDTFISMYDVDNFFDKICKDIAGEPNNIQQPELGSLRIQEIKDSDYFFA